MRAAAGELIKVRGSDASEKDRINSYGELLQFNSISGDTSVAGAAGNAGITSNYRVDNFCFQCF